MFEEEFDLLIEKQRPFHSEILTDEFIKTLRAYFFQQRPLKSQRSLIGKCSLETDPPQQRIGCYRPEFQHFRVLQNVNHLRIKMPDGTITPLDEKQRAKLLQVLTHDSEISHTNAKKLLGLKPKYTFTIDKDDAKKIIGNRTQAAMRKIFESKWDEMSPEDQLSAITDLVSIREENVLYNRAKRRWNLSDPAAFRMSRTVLEEGYGYLSKKAIQKLLPHLEKGLSYKEAVDLVYPAPEKTMLYDELPTLQNHHATDIRNPLVKRTLSQLRIVVNAIIKKWGKPAKIRIELARDLKNPPKVREKMIKKNKTGEQENARIKNMLCEERRFNAPSPDDILKVKLMEECRGICPYSGNIITMDKLFGGDFDIEHIIPLSRSLDNSFANKTLCDTHFNRHIKKNQTPYEARFHDTQAYNDMINRVKIWGSQNGKLERFEMDAETLKDHLETFSSRQLNDTRYATLDGPLSQSAFRRNSYGREAKNRSGRRRHYRINASSARFKRITQQNRRKFQIT